MGQVSFGTVLREARERKGYDVQSAARRLRIRPDILRALENNDFSRLPARGYTRNMVNAYAKLVGLNPADITRMYLDDAYAYQVGRTRGESDSPAHVSGRRSVSRGDGRHDGGDGDLRGLPHLDVTLIGVAVVQGEAQLGVVDQGGDGVALVDGVAHLQAVPRASVLHCPMQKL